MRERARHVSSESKAIAIRAAEARHLSTYGEPLQLPSCLAVIQNHCCYLSSPLLCGLNREEVLARMENLNPILRGSNSYLIKRYVNLFVLRTLS